MCLWTLPLLSTRVSLFFLRALLKIKQGQTEGPGYTSGIWSEVVELKVTWEGHVLPWQAHIVEFQVVGVTTR